MPNGVVKEGRHFLYNRFKIHCHERAGFVSPFIQIFVYNFREEMTSLLTPSVTVTPLPARTLRQTLFVETNISDLAVCDGKITYACLSFIKR